MAMTAWSAKVVTNSICFSVKGLIEIRNKVTTPIGTPSRNSGTPSIERCFPRRAASCIVYSGSVRQSGICTARRSRAVLPTTDPRSTLIGCSDQYLTHSELALFDHAM